MRENSKDLAYSEQVLQKGKELIAAEEDWLDAAGEAHHLAQTGDSMRRCFFLAVEDWIWDHHA